MVKTRTHEETTNNRKTNKTYPTRNKTGEEETPKTTPPTSRTLLKLASILSSSKAEKQIINYIRTAENKAQAIKELATRYEWLKQRKPKAAQKLLNMLIKETTTANQQIKEALAKEALTNPNPALEAITTHAIPPKTLTQATIQELKNKLPPNTPPELTNKATKEHILEKHSLQELREALAKAIRETQEILELINKATEQAANLPAQLREKTQRKIQETIKQAKTLQETKQKLITTLQETQETMNTLSTINQIATQLSKTTGQPQNQIAETLTKYIEKYPQTHKTILKKLAQQVKQNPQQTLQAIKQTKLPTLPENFKQIIKRTLKQPPNYLGRWISSIAFPPDGMKMAVGVDYRIFLFSSSGSKLWESQDLEDEVYSVAWSPDGTKIATGVGPRIIVFSLSGDKFWERNLGWEVYSVAWSPDGTKIATAVGFKIIIFSSLNGRVLWKKSLGEEEARCVAWSPQGDKLVAGVTNGVVVFSLSDNKILWKVRNLNDSADSVAWSPDGTKIATAVGFKIIIFSSLNGRVLWKKSLGEEEARCVAWSPQGDKLAIGTGWIDDDNYEHGHVIIFSLTTEGGKKIWESCDQGMEVSSVAWSPQGDKLVANGVRGVTVSTIFENLSLSKVTNVCKENILDSTLGLVGEGLRCACSGDWDYFASALDIWREVPLVNNSELILYVASLFSPLEVRDVLDWFEWFSGKFNVSVDSDSFLDDIVKRLISCRDGESLVKVGVEFSAWIKGLAEELYNWGEWYAGLDEEVRGVVKEFIRGVAGGGVLDFEELKSLLEDVKEFVSVLDEDVEELRPEVGFVDGSVAGKFSKVGVRVCFSVGVPGTLSLVGAEVGGGGEVRVPKQGFRVDPRSKCVEIPLHVLVRVPGEVPIDLRFRFSGLGGLEGEFVRTVSLRVVPRGSVSGESEELGVGGEGCVSGRLGGPAESTGSVGVVGVGSLGFPEVLRGLFEPLEFLGEGGFGRVWRVRRVSDGSVSAVKVPVFSSPELGRVFLREVSVWLRLKHRNIVGLRDANVVPVPYLEMEFVPGATVNGKLVRCLEDLPKPVEPGLAVKLFEGVAAGVAYAHSVGVIHRDLKPLNVLLDKGLTPKVSDWGLAKLAAMTTSRVGLKAYSPAYATPEQIDEETYGGTDERIDIYQLGLMLYELLTGRLPYEASTPAALTAKVVREDVSPVPPSKHSPELKPFDAPILKALSKRKELRYSRVEDFVRDVREALRKYLSAAGEDLEAVRREVEEVKRTLRKSVRRRASREEVRALKARYAELLGKYAVAALREGEVEEAIEGLEELVYYTRKHEEELAKLIQEVEVMVRSDAPITEGLIKRVKLLAAKIVAEARGGK